MEPVDGGGSEWSTCTKSCGGGIRERSCTNPKPAGGKLCLPSRYNSQIYYKKLEDYTEEQDCNLKECPGLEFGQDYSDYWDGYSGRGCLPGNWHYFDDKDCCDSTTYPRCCHGPFTKQKWCENPPSSWSGTEAKIVKCCDVFVVVKVERKFLDLKNLEW